jgi:hypothetical protein
VHDFVTRIGLGRASYAERPMNIRTQIFGSEDADPVVGEKKPRGAKA